MEFKNDLGLVGKIAAHSVMSGKYKDKDGNIKEILPIGPGNSLDFDQFREDISAFGGGSGGTDIDPDHPSAGADYYAGSLGDGEITERNLEWSGTDDPTKDLTVTFKDDPGSNPFGQYSGLTILGHIQKTVMTSGTKGAVSNLELNYDPSNATKDGYFTTTSPYPIYISQSDIASGQELDVPINGIGEGLEGDNTKPAMIHLKYNSDKTMTISHEEGYVNDGSSAGATGANYSFVVEIVATFSTQKAVYQLPSTINLFSGLATDNIALAGADNFYENVMDGIEIQLDKYARHPTKDIMVYSNQIGIKNRTIRIPKEQLILDNSFKILEDRELPVPAFYAYDHSGNKVGSVYSGTNVGECIITVYSNYFNISIPVTLGAVSNKGSQQTVGIIYVNVIKVTPYKN